MIADLVKLVRACANVILAEHGEPEPADETPVTDTIDLLNAIADELRSES